jgi:transposase
MCTIDRKNESESRGSPFSTTTRDLLELGDWLAAQGITHVAMEATGVYWKPIWHILEGRFELVLANAAHIRNVPGRKSDVNDAVWVSDLLAHGLIRASFVPPAQIQDVRDLTRTRTQLVREIAQHTQRIQKTLENANIKLTSVISDIVGTSGRRILKAMIAGETNPAKLAELGSTRLQCPRAELIAALDGRVTAHHRFLIAIISDWSRTWSDTSHSSMLGSTSCSLRLATPSHV